MSDREPTLASRDRPRIDDQGNSRSPTIQESVLGALSPSVGPKTFVGGGNLGPYRLLERIAEGGASHVYRAVRNDAGYELEVAVKVLRVTCNGDEMARRFFAERQILAALSHPNIAQLLDGGTTAEGAPYLVTEYISGMPLDVYCDEHELSIQERLELFLKVTGAVEEAHRNLIVHRDLKPSNILVTADREPKLLDFGIAKLLDAEPAGVFEPTRFTCRLMTPEYASPEQIRGDVVTTASDVYSLGVLLYQLLTGERPYDFRSASVQQMLEIVGQRAATVPSDRARERGERHLARELRGDLDTIVLHALQKEPRQRYPSVEALAEDVRRYLTGQPVLARRPSLGYRLGKLVRRHPWPVGLGLTAGFLGLSYVRSLLAHRSRVQRALVAEESSRHEAEMHEAKAGAIQKFLLDILGAADLEMGQGPATTVVEAVERAVAKVDEKLADDPALVAAVKEVLGRTLCSLGRFEKAEGLLREALRIQRKVLPADHPDTARTLHSLGLVLIHGGRLDEAERAYRESLMIRERLFGEEHLSVAASWDSLGSVFLKRRDLDAAWSSQEKALAIRSLVHPQAGAALSESFHNLGLTAWCVGELREAELYLRRALAIDDLRPGHPKRGTTLLQLAWVRFELGFYEEAGRLAQRCLELFLGEFGQDHPSTSRVRLLLAWTLAFRGFHDEAERQIREVLQGNNRQENEDSVTGCLMAFGFVLTERRRWARAEGTLLEALNRVENFHGAESVEFARCLEKLGMLYLAQSETVRTRPLLERSLGLFERLTPRHWNTARNKSLLGRCLHALGEHHRAESLLREGLERIEEVLGPDHRFTREARERWDAFLADRGGLTADPAASRWV